MNAVLCPNCGQKVEISQAFRQQIEDQILQQAKAKHKEELDRLKKEVEEKALQKAKEEFTLQLKNSQNEVLEEKERNKELLKELTELTKQLRELKEKDELREIEMQKQLIKEREKIQEEVMKVEREKANLEKMELQKQLNDTKKALEEAKRKAEQKSQQLQGEVLELDLESQLHESFPFDEIAPIPKGIEGGDIWQKVRNKHGQIAGSILWETKRTKAWSNAWAGKLRENTRQIGASVSILVSDVLPDGIDKFGLYENIWVTSYEYALPLVNVIRVGLMQIAIAKSAASHKDQKLEALYAYLTDDGFRHRFEAQVESIIELKRDLEAEQRSVVRSWKKREMQINRMRNNLSSLYGELQGILGQALPTLPNLEIGELPSGDEQQSLLDT